MRLVHDAHPAPAELFEEFVAADNGSLRPEHFGPAIRRRVERMRESAAHADRALLRRVQEGSALIAATVD